MSRSLGLEVKERPAEWPTARCQRQLVVTEWLHAIGVLRRIDPQDLVLGSKQRSKPSASQAAELETRFDEDSRGREQGAGDDEYQDVAHGSPQLRRPEDSAYFRYSFCMRSLSALSDAARANR